MRRLRRNFYLLVALRWIPTGLSVIVFVLLMTERGLSLAEIGVGTAAQGVVMLVLELPSGGLADALGRRPVLVLASATGIAATTLLLAVHDVWLLAIVFALNGASRALDSGPLQAWFVDEAIAIDPQVDIERELGREGVILCASIGAGALLGSGLARFDGLLGIDRLAVPLVVSLFVQLISLGAITMSMHEHRASAGWAGAARSFAEVPAVIHGAVTAIRASRLLLALVVAEFSWGFGMIAFEFLFPPRLAELSGGVDEAAVWIGPVVTGAWVLSALGAAAGPCLGDKFGSGWAGCGLRLMQSATVVVMGLVAGPIGFVVAFLATYWLHGAANPVHYGLVHRNVESTHRATVISANSLTSQVGGAISGIALGALADATSISTAMIVAGLVLAVGAPLYLIGQGTATPSAPSEPLPSQPDPSARTPARLTVGGQRSHELASTRAGPFISMRTVAGARSCPCDGSPVMTAPCAVTRAFWMRCDSSTRPTSE
jgi:MFS family permease